LLASEAVTAAHSSPLRSNAIARTQPSRPAPSGAQSVPSHAATLFTGTPPASVKMPAAYVLPSGPIAMSSTRDPEPDGPGNANASRHTPIVGSPTGIGAGPVPPPHPRHATSRSRFMTVHGARGTPARAHWYLFVIALRHHGFLRRWSRLSFVRRA